MGESDTTMTTGEHGTSASLHRHFIKRSAWKGLASPCRYEIGFESRRDLRHRSHSPHSVLPRFGLPNLFPLLSFTVGLRR